MPEEEQKVPQKQQKGNSFNWVLIIGALIALLWLLYLTNLATIGNFVPENELNGFKEKIAPVVFLATLFYLIGLVFNYYLKDKMQSWKKTDGSPIILESSHVRFPEIQETAKVHYQLKLGRCVKTSPLSIHTQTGSLSPTRFFLFEKLYAGRVIGYSEWYVNYARKITVHLSHANYFGFADKKHYWTGEPKQEVATKEVSLGLKKGNEINAVESEEELGSMTD